MCSWWWVNESRSRVCEADARLLLGPAPLCFSFNLSAPPDLQAGVFRGHSTSAGLRPHKCSCKWHIGEVPAVEIPSEGPGPVRFPPGSRRGNVLVLTYSFPFYSADVPKRSSKKLLPCVLLWFIALMDQ